MFIAIVFFLFRVHVYKLGQVTNLSPTIQYSTWFCFSTVRSAATLLCRASYMLGFATHFYIYLHMKPHPQRTLVLETRANVGLGNCCAWWTQCRITALAEIARHASRWMLSQCKIPHFSVTSGLAQQNSRLQDIGVWVGFRLHVYNVTYPGMCLFPLSVALCDHNPQTLQTDRQTDGRRAGSIGAICYMLLLLYGTTVH